MKTNSVNNTSFRSVYSLNGKIEVLNEVSKYLGNVKMRPESSFDFINIRYLQAPVLRDNAFWGSLNQEDMALIKAAAQRIKESHPDVSFETPSSNAKASDLILTGGHFHIVKSQMRNMVASSIQMFMGKMSPPMTLEEFSTKVCRSMDIMEKNVSNGKPVTNINFAVLRFYLGELFDLPHQPIIEAEEAFKGLQANATRAFDFREGVFA